MINYYKHPKLTPVQREEIIAIAMLQRGPYNAYPCSYIAALYGVRAAYITQLVSRAGKFRRGSNSSRAVSQIGLRAVKTETKAA